MAKPLPPFSCTYSPNVPELLAQLKCTIALSTYQAGKVVFLSAKGADKMIQLPRTFSNAMGIATSENKLAVACKNEVVVLANTPSMAPNYPPQPNTYDGLYLPRALYYTGQCALHDMNWQNGQLLAINTLFSCLSAIDEDYTQIGCRSNSADGITKSAFFEFKMSSIMVFNKALTESQVKLLSDRLA